MTARNSNTVGEGPAPDEGLRALFAQFTLRLIGLARAHLGARLRNKVDPEDVVQSAYKSFYLRYEGETVISQGSEALWSLLTLITVRKCADRARYHQADCRDVAREALPPRDDESALRQEPFGREPTPVEAAMLSETVEQLLADLDEQERPILELSLQGYSTREIGERLGRAERTVRLLRERVRHRLEQMRSESS